MTTEDLASIEEFAQKAAREAGRVTLDYFGGSFEVELKSDDSPVTIADRKAEELLRNLIEKEFPGHSILGEEFGESSRTGSHRWILDPIDGTKAFVAGVPQYTVLIALETGGEVVVGVIYNPTQDRMMSARLGGGCQLNGQPVRVSSKASLAEASILCSDYTNLLKRDPTCGSRVLEICKSAPGWGDAYGYSLVAEGKQDAMIDPKMSYWDVAAVKICIEEAGGIFTDWDGNPGPDVRSGVAANPILHGEILKVLGEKR